MDPLRNVNVFIVVFAMPGCPACEDYLPRFRRHVAALQRQGHPFAYFSPDRPVSTSSIPVAIYDAGSEDPGIQAFADQHRVTGLPTTLILTRYHGIQRYEGSVSDKDILAGLRLADAVR